MIKKDNGTTVPSQLVLGLSQEDKEKAEEYYKSSGYILRLIRKYLNNEMEKLYRESESMEEPMQLIKNAAERKAVRKITKLFPEVNNG